VADLTIYPPPEPPFDPPPPEECEEWPGIPVVLAAGHEIRSRLVLWQQWQVVEFAAMQMAWMSGSWVQICRIDTEHNMVHRHQLRQDKPDDDVGMVTDLEFISQAGGTDLIGRWYDEGIDLMQAEWEESIRRWKQ